VTGQPTTTQELTDTRVFYAGAHPNPSGGNTTLYFSLAEKMRVHLAVFDLRGRLVRELVDEDRGPGAHAVAWDGRDAEGISAAPKE
jgi:flagellar hook assembly protein FlgD